MIRIIVNGEEREIAPPCSLQDFVGSLNLPSQRVVIEHNGEVVPSGKWGEKELHDGDRLEIVHFVGGG